MYMTKTEQAVTVHCLELPAAAYCADEFLDEFPDELQSATSKVICTFDKDYNKDEFTMMSELPIEKRFK